MPNIQRRTDINNGGGEITNTLQTTVSANGLLVSVNGSTVSDHDIHLNTKTTGGSANVFINGISVNFTGNKDSCDIHSRIGGSENVTVN